MLSTPETGREGEGPMSRAGIWVQGGQEDERGIPHQEVALLEENKALSAAGVLLSWGQMRKEKSVQLGKITGKGCRVS